MKLEQLLKDIEVLECNVPMEMDIPSVVYDSRKVTPGCMFVAVVGYATDGNKYIPMRAVPVCCMHLLYAPYRSLRHRFSQWTRAHPTFC